MVVHQVVALMEQYGPAVIFVAVLIERAGLPIPAFPVLVVAAGAAPHADSLLQILLLGVAASLAADLAWYFAGQRYGYRILKTLCRISISPDSCVSQTQSIFTQWGLASLLVAKFIPGFSTMAPPLAGAFKQRLASFLLYDTLGSMIWCGSAIALGAIFHDAVDDVLGTLVHFGGLGLLLVIGALGLFLGYKWLQRQRLIRDLRMDRITVDELRDLIRRGAAPVIIDARPKEAQELDGMIPGAVAYVESAMDSLASSLMSSAEVVVYCACPNEVSAAKIAQQLMKMGVRRVRPLLGGMEAWTAAHTSSATVVAAGASG